MSKRIDSTIIEQIPILYEKYENKAKVARELNVSTATVNKYLTLYNSAPVEVVKKKRVKIDEETERKINELYSTYRNLSQVARELNIAPTTVKNHLNKENLELNKRLYDDRDALWFYIYKLFGPESEDKPVSNWNITQMMKFNQQGINYRAQLLTLKYYYEVQHHTVSPQYKTIGIIPYIVNQAAAYYASQSQKQKEIEKAIEKQLEQDRIEIKYNPSDYIGRKKKKKHIDLNKIEGD